MADANTSDLTCSMRVALKSSNCPFTKALSYAWLLTFASWVVSVGGLASIQDECPGDPFLLNIGVNGFSPVSSCRTLYRFYWFIIAMEFVVLVIAGGVLWLGAIGKGRNAVVALLAVATMLYIKTTDSFLSLQTDTLPKWHSGVPKDRLNTMIAGCIMTATFNCILILAYGYTAEHPPIKAEEKEKESTVAVAVS